MIPKQSRGAWRIQAIEFVENVKPIFKGEGGYAQDNEFFGTMANI